MLSLSTDICVGSGSLTDDAAEEELAGVRRALHSGDEGSVYARQRRVKNEAEQLDAIRLTDGAWIHSSPAGIEIVETVAIRSESKRSLVAMKKK